MIVEPCGIVMPVNRSPLSTPVPLYPNSTSGVVVDHAGVQVLLYPASSPEAATCSFMVVGVGVGVGVGLAAFAVEIAPNTIPTIKAITKAKNNTFFILHSFPDMSWF